MTTFREGLVAAINAERGARGLSNMKGFARLSGVPYGSLRNYLEHGRDIPATVIAQIAMAMGMAPSQLVLEAERRMALANEQEA